MALVNWSQLWRQMLQDTGRIEFCSPSYWDKQAASMNKNTEQLADLTKKQLERLLNLSDCTVLEVGAGTGRITVPLAKRAKHVTALEPSPNMMALLKANVQKANLNNVEYVKGSIGDLDAKAVGLYDVVIASFSLFMIDIEANLQKINEAASQRVCIFSCASEWMDKAIQNILYIEGKAPSNLPDYLYFKNTLQNMGISANVDIWEFQYNQSYGTLADAAAKFMQSYHAPTAKQDELKAYLAKTLVADDKGRLWLKRKRKAAMVWWTKNK
jgi:SAM-dependent methyltransferase